MANRKKPEGNWPLIVLKHYSVFLRSLYFLYPTAPPAAIKATSPPSNGTLGGGGGEAGGGAVGFFANQLSMIGSSFFCCANTLIEINITKEKAIFFIFIYF